MALYLCVDCGGSKTAAAIANASGEIIGRAYGGPSNFAYLGVDAFIVAVSEAVGDALKTCTSPPFEERVPLPPTIVTFAAAWFGVSGVDSPAAVATITPALSKLLGIPAGPRLVVANDTHLLAAPIRFHPDASCAVAVIGGTGSISVSFRETGGALEELGRIGGWGWILGDEGGGFHVGRETVRQLLLEHDKASVTGNPPPNGPLRSRILSHFGISDLMEILTVIHLPDPSPSANIRADALPQHKAAREKRLSTLSPIVFAAAFEDKDPLAIDVLRICAGTLASEVAVLLHDEKNPQPKAVKASESIISFGGSLVGIPAYRDMVLSALAERGHVFIAVDTSAQPPPVLQLLPGTLPLTRTQLTPLSPPSLLAVMAGIPNRFLRVLQLFFVAYIGVAVVFTTYHMMTSGSPFSLPTSLGNHPWYSLAFSNSLSFIRSGEAADGDPPSLDVPETELNVTRNNDIFLWDSGLNDHGRIPMDERLFLSKAFGNAMGPTKVIPFFYKASVDVDPEDITITTLITSNRFAVFSRLVEHYQGPISVTIHIKNETQHMQELLDSLHNLYTSSPSMSAHVDVHLVIDNFERQFNMWRNVARLFARTDYVMMLDVDFALCTDFRSAIKNSPSIFSKLKEGNSAFVIPAFEYVNASEGVDSATFPRDKPALLSLVNEQRIGMFHASWDPGHNSTDYTRYYSSQPGEVYKVTQYQSAYEPYVVFKKNGPPWCDERFVGYGGNKAACLFEMYISGISFYVLADHFIIHQNHAYEETARKNERRYNRKVYADFKEEACLRYIRMFHSKGLLNETVGYNVQNECPNIKNVARLAGQLID